MLNTLPRRAVICESLTESPIGNSNRLTIIKKINLILQLEYCPDYVTQFFC